ncbi:hypothetical protein [Leifsonia sp. 71-9]|uniref:hypothetical protein n=1 Tax=Leifsonia sp. 71-9 TaxID=1895934 RepID=UPI00092A0F8C|nr:hypothetical protein [Leifsonia sp. 71-9]OJX72456.1 MAG: hypothetical protein BGO91_01400 [Leifsonia sp. 71-9]
MPPIRRIVTVALAASVLLAVSGCAELGLPLPGTPTGTATPTGPAAPPAFALDCPATVGAADLASVLGAQATAVTTPPGILASAAAAGPLALPAVGGAACRWKHGTDTLVVQVLPHAAAAWTTLAAAYPNAATPGADYDGGVSLGGDCTLTPTVICRTNVLVGEAWLAVELTAAAAPGLTEAGFHDIVQRALPSVAAAVAKAPSPVPAAKAFDCADPGLRAELQQTFALPAVTSMGTEPTFRIADAVIVAPGATLCAFQPNEDGSGGYLGSLSVLPGTAAAYEQLRAAVLAQDPSAHSEMMTVKGEQVPALVWGVTADDTAFTSVDAMIGTRWVEFRSTDPDDSRSLAIVQWVAATL